MKFRKNASTPHVGAKSTPIQLSPSQIRIPVAPLISVITERKRPICVEIESRMFMT